MSQLMSLWLSAKLVLAFFPTTAEIFVGLGWKAGTRAKYTFGTTFKSDFLNCAPAGISLVVYTNGTLIPGRSRKSSTWMTFLRGRSKSGRFPIISQLNYTPPLGKSASEIFFSTIILFCIFSPFRILVTATQIDLLLADGGCFPIAGPTLKHNDMAIRAQTNTRYKQCFLIYQLVQ